MRKLETVHTTEYSVGVESITVFKFYFDIILPLTENILVTDT